MKMQFKSNVVLLSQKVVENLFMFQSAHLGLFVLLQSGTANRVTSCRVPAGGPTVQYQHIMCLKGVSPSRFFMHQLLNTDISADG